MTESWKPIAGYEGVYSVSDLGRIRRDGKANGTTPGLILSPRKLNGYLQIGLRLKGKGQQLYYVHRLVANAFIGPLQESCEVNHKDGNGTNNLVRNLEYVTPSQNIQHAIRNGVRFGHKLSSEEVKRLRIAWQSSEKKYGLISRWSRELGRTRNTIRNAVIKESWKHLA